jgi:formate hydrogenlyase subunit 3/multisubunit Na+/H+ antiporter MnhD subunit
VTVFYVGLGLILCGAAAGVLVRRPGLADRAFVILAVAGCATAAAPAVAVLAGRSLAPTRLASTLPGGDWVIAIDTLSALFLVAVLGIGAASAGFGVGYLASEREHGAGPRRVSLAHALFAVLLVALAILVTAQAVTLFLAAWEVMALSAFFLTVFDYEREEVRRAGLLYIVTTHTGTLALFAMFAVWAAPAGDWTFAALSSSAPGAARTGAILALALTGFGVKAGFVPLHFWLPQAHAAAPSHVSALLSGVVIKSGIYGLLRVVTMLGGAPPAWWGWTVLAIGVASGVLGVLWALAQHDIKRLLAYHSVENIGIILIGAGVGSLGASYGHPAVAVLGFTGAALHTVNHGLFKSLLFLGAGAVYRLTGTRDMERLGGVGRRMPLTWLAFLIGSVAIIGVPPLNGFVSEWVVYQALFRAGQAPGALRLAILGAAGLALIGGLALACFAKVGGVVFLGQPREPALVPAHEARRALVAPMAGLAAACVLVGLFPVVAVRPILRVGAAVANLPAALDEPAVLQAAESAAWVGVMAVSLLGLTGVGFALRHLVLRRRPVETGPTWGCGYPAVTPRMQYTASSFAAPLLDGYGRASGVRVHRTGTRFETEPVDLVLDGAVLPLWGRVLAVSRRLRPIQQGRLHVYLLYVILAVVAVLAYLAASITP